ncbi:hypothetical protein FNV43_RR11815 [Rhamnella rubrinervis]|uniref:Uncharacterized protein n=1 Tax=Rhamnella rubrinervis TaxID=2594499 RepID=A0A8K0H6J1_9ROSA|nr:hypothetical protein FNV43_RR11815 [Rhamnella rubrinervis]
MAASGLDDDAQGRGYLREFLLTNSGRASSRFYFIAREVFPRRAKTGRSLRKVCKTFVLVQECPDHALLSASDPSFHEIRGRISAKSFDPA